MNINKMVAGMLLLGSMIMFIGGSRAYAQYAQTTPWTRPCEGCIVACSGEHPGGCTVEWGTETDCNNVDDNLCTPTNGCVVQTREVNNCPCSC
jgi:hypothetical protein